MRNLKVSQKLFASFGVLSLLVLGMGVIGLLELNRADHRLAGMYGNNLQATARLGDIRAEVLQATALSSKLILHSPLDSIDDVRSTIATLDAEIDKTWATYETTAAAGTGTDRQQFTDALADYRSAREQRLVPAAEKNDFTGFLGVQNSAIDPLTTRLNATLTKLARTEDDAAHSRMVAADRAARTANILIPAVIGGAVLVAIVLTLTVSRAIARPLRRTVEVLEGLADGRLDQRLAIAGRDEVGRMAAALNTALDRLTGTLRGISGNVSSLAGSSAELTTVAARMKSSASRSAERAQAVALASGEISQNIATVSAGADEIGSSIGEIAQSTSSAADVAGQAVRISTEAGAILQKLGASSAEIVSVIKIITGIAEQTNLLALNATIEAARAGDAGKGFAVVAGEVKELAGETARATEDIRNRVSAIQSDSAAAVAAIAEIGGVIEQINNTQSAIAAAVEEQTATTNEMGRNVDEVAGGSSEISANVAEVAAAAAETTDAAENTARAADSLAQVSHELQRSLAMFRY